MADNTILAERELLSLLPKAPRDKFQTQADWQLFEDVRYCYSGIIYSLQRGTITRREAFPGYVSLAHNVFCIGLNILGNLFLELIDADYWQKGVFEDIAVGMAKYHEADALKYKTDKTSIEQRQKLMHESEFVDVIWHLHANYKQQPIMVVPGNALDFLDKLDLTILEKKSKIPFLRVVKQDDINDEEEII